MVLIKPMLMFEYEHKKDSYMKTARHIRWQREN